MGSYGLRRVQIGAESTKGTAVSAAKVLTGLDGQIKDDSELSIRPLDYMTGLLPGSNSGTPVFLTNVWSASIDGDATYENLPYVLSAGWQAVTATTSGTSATWTFNSPATAINAVKTMTLETGDDTEQLKGAYALVDEFEISGKTNDVLQLKTKWLGRAVTAGTGGFDSATALGATPIPFNLCKLYVDPGTATVGTTAVTATLREMTLKVKSGFHHKQFADGSLYPTSDGQAKPEVSMDVVLEYNSSATGVRSDWKAGNQKRVRFASASAVTANPTFYFDLAGYWSDVAEIKDADGNTTVAATFTAAPAGTTSSDFCNFKVINSATGGL